MHAGTSAPRIDPSPTVAARRWTRAAFAVATLVAVAAALPAVRAAEHRNRPVSSPDAPAAIGPYSAAIVVPPGRMVFLSGQLPLDPATGQIVAGDITVMTHRVMQNLGAVLAAAGGGFDDVVKCTIYTIDLSEFAAINAAYGSYFGEAPPARATVQVAALPRGGRVEIECIAVLP
jgi:2-iminobutanoate/2-iminopropanoate deaminase